MRMFSLSEAESNSLNRMVKVTTTAHTAQLFHFGSPLMVKHWFMRSMHTAYFALVSDRRQRMRE